MQNYQKLPKQPHFSSDNFLSAHFSLRRGESETAIPSLIDGETPARRHSPCSGAEKWMPNGGGKSPKENPSRRMAAAVLANGKSAAEWRLPRCRTESLLPSRRCRCRLQNRRCRMAVGQRLSPNPRPKSRFLQCLCASLLPPQKTEILAHRHAQHPLRETLSNQRASASPAFYPHPFK